MPSSESRPWSRRRWWTLIGLVFALHVWLIFAFSERPADHKRRVAKVARLRLVAGEGELLALSDPTLFALPHARSSTVKTWLPVPRAEYAPFRWSEPPRFLPLPSDQLGGTFVQFMRTNTFARFEFEMPSRPELVLPESPPPFTPPTRSELRVRGDLAQRPLLNPPELSSWPAADLLTNSVVRVQVDSMGHVFSTTLVPPGSGSRAADRRALELARSLRFAPLTQPPLLSADSLGALSGGVLVFEWHTVPLPPATNPPAAAPVIAP